MINHFLILKGFIPPRSRYSFRPFLHIILVENSQCAEELIVLIHLPNSSNDLGLLFCLFPSVMGLTLQHSHSIVIPQSFHSHSRKQKDTQDSAQLDQQRKIPLLNSCKNHFGIQAKIKLNFANRYKKLVLLHHSPADLESALQFDPCANFLCRILALQQICLLCQWRSYLVQLLPPFRPAGEDITLRNLHTTRHNMLQHSTW